MAIISVVEVRKLKKRISIMESLHGLATFFGALQHWYPFSHTVLSAFFCYCCTAFVARIIVVDVIK